MQQTRRSRFTALACALLAALVLMTGCTAGGGGGSGGSGGEITIGAVVPITGPLSLSGEFYYNTLRMAQDDVNAAGGVNGKKLKILFEDSRDSNSTAVNAYNKLVKANTLPFVFLTSYSTQILATSPEVVKTKIPSFYAGGAGAVADQKNPYLFRIVPNDGLQALAMVKYATEGLHKSKPGILYIQNDFGQGAAKDAEQTLKTQGINVVGMEAYRDSDKDMSAQLLSLKKKGADIVLGFVYPTDGALLLKQMKELGIGVPFFVSSGGYLPSALALVSEKDLEGTLGIAASFLPGSTDPKTADFLKRYKERFKKDSDFTYGPAYYDAVWILVEGIKKVGPDAEKLREYLAGLKDYKGIGHQYSCDSKGECVHDVWVVKAKAGTKDLEPVQNVQVQ